MFFHRNDGLKNGLRKRFYLVVDLEATCCETYTTKSPFQANEREIIEIGAVIIDSDSLQMVDRYQAFVKPKNHPILTDFCKELTHIKQEDVDSADDFEQAFRAMKQHLYREGYQDYVFCAWGNFDFGMMKLECERAGLSFDFKNPINLKSALLKKQPELKNKSAGRLGDAVEILGLSWQGEHHRAIDDAINTAQLLPWIVGDQIFTLSNEPKQFHWSCNTSF